MRVQDIFRQQQETQLGITEKFLLYQKILQQQEQNEKKKDMQKKIIRKGIVTICILVFSLGFLFQIYPSIKNGVQYTGYELLDTDLLFTHANQVGTILKAQGYFEIISNGRKIITDQINDGDIVTLDEESSLVMKINETMQATVVGPAKFSIHKQDVKEGINQYQIRMIQGDYVAIKNLTGSSPDAAIQIATAEGVIVEQDQKKLNKTKKENNITDFVFTKKNKKPIIVNKGQDLLQIKRVDPRSVSKTTLVSKIETQGVLLMDIETNNTYIQPLSGGSINDLSQQTGENTSGYLIKYESGSNNENKSGDVIPEVTSLIQQTLTDPLIVSGSKEDIVVSKSGQTIGGKKPLPADVVYKIQQRLYSSFVFNDITNLVTYYLLGKHQQFSISYTNLQARIHEIYTLVGKEKIVATYDVQGLLLQIDELRAFLAQNYIIPASIRKNLLVLSNWLHLLQTYSFGQFAQKDQSMLSFDELVQKAGIDTNKQSLKFK